MVDRQHVRQCVISTAYTELMAFPRTQLKHHLSLCHGPGFYKTSSATMSTDLYRNVEESIMPYFILISDDRHNSDLRMNCTITGHHDSSASGWCVDMLRCFERKRDFESALPTTQRPTHEKTNVAASSNTQSTGKRQVKASKKRRIEDSFF